MKIMKKFAAIAAAGLLVVSLGACGSTTTESDATETNTTTETETSTADTDTTAETSTEAATDETETEEATESVTGSVTGSGSSALLPLAQDAADKFKELNPDVSITLNAGGSGQGLKDVAAGTVDIGNSDVAAEKKLEADQVTDLVDHKVCVVTMAPIVNNDIAAEVPSLTKEQLIGIFTAEITNWSEVGGPDEDIILVTRPSTSGTRALFQEYALDGAEEASNASLETDDSGTLLQTVASQKGAIGYVALSYLTDNDTVSAMAIDGVEPSLENTYNGTYPVWGYEHMYTKGEAEGAVAAYLEYVMSDDYGQYVEELGYGVTSKMTVER